VRSITLPFGWDAFPKIYEPWTGEHIPRPRFSVRVPLNLVEDIEGFRIWSDTQTASIHSFARPEVSAAMGIDWLVAALIRSDAQNISRDHFLSKQQLRIWFEPTPYGPTRHLKRSGVSLQLKKVHIL